MKRARIRSEIFTREDIKNILRGISSASGDLARHLPLDKIKIYQAGFDAAIAAAAKAFDIEA